jgi:hypothetical protein
MSTALITMAWLNDSTSSLTYQAQGNPENGYIVAPTPTTMSPVGNAGNTATVSAGSNSSLYGPGPEGTYQWQIVGTNPTQYVSVSYNHPFGNDTTTVTVTCPAGYLAQGGGQGPAQTLALNQNCSSLQDHDNAYCQITVSQTAAS